jgi:hypothetical protein
VKLKSSHYIKINLPDVLEKQLRHSLYFFQSVQLERIMSETDKGGEEEAGSQEEAGPASDTRSGLHQPFSLRLPEDVKRHDLAPIHSLLLDLAISLQVKVNKEIENIGRIRRRLSMEM